MYYFSVGFLPGCEMYYFSVGFLPGLTTDVLQRTYCQRLLLLTRIGPFAPSTDRDDTCCY